MSENADRAKQRRFRQEGSPAEIQETIDFIRSVDRGVERRRRRWYRGIAEGFLGSIACGIVISIQQWDSLVFLPVLLLGLGVASIVMAIITNKQDILDDRYALVERVLHLLSGELRKSSPLSLQVDLRKLRHQEKQRDITRTDKVGPWQTTAKSGPFKHSYFEDPWLTLGGRLCDGCRFELRFTDYLFVRRGWVTTQRNKKKLKEKLKHAFLAELRLDVPQERFGSLTGLQEQAQRAMQLPGDLRLKPKLRLQGQRAELSLLCKGAWGASELGRTAQALESVSLPSRTPRTDAVPLIGQMFLNLYQVLNFARQQRQRSAA